MNLEAQRLELGSREFHLEPGLAAFEMAGAVVRAERTAGDEQQAEDEQIDQQDGRKLADEGLPELRAWNRQERSEPDRQLRRDDHVKGAQARTDWPLPVCHGPDGRARTTRCQPSARLRPPAPRTTRC